MLGRRASGWRQLDDRPEQRYYEIMEAATDSDLLVKFYLTNIDPFIFSMFIEPMYNEKHRCYHNLTHIEDSINIFDDYLKNHAVVEYVEVLTALYFHDIIYNPERQDNEERSARLAYHCCNSMNYLRAGPNKINANHVSDLILCTAHLDKSNKIFNSDQHVVLDIDLSILGAKPEKYKAYENNIRKEYGFVSDEVFYPLRKSVLEKFVGLAKANQLYHLEYFKDRFNSNALENLSDAITKNETLSL